MAVIRFKRMRRLTTRQRWKEALLITATASSVDLPFARGRDLTKRPVRTPQLKLVVAANS